MGVRTHHKLDGEVCRLANRRQHLIGSVRTFQRTGDGLAVVGPNLPVGFT